MWDWGLVLRVWGLGFKLCGLVIMLKGWDQGLSFGVQGVFLKHWSLDNTSGNRTVTTTITAHILKDPHT